MNAGIIADLAAAGILVNPNGVVEQHVRCPQCDRKRRDTALSVNIENGLYNCFRCGHSGRARRESTGGRAPIIRIDDPAIVERKRERLRRIWRESAPLADPRAHTVRAYLDSRALGAVLKAPPPVLRAHKKASVSILPYGTNDRFNETS
jgi:hypothetical protein